MPWRAIRPAAWAWPDYLGWKWKSKAGLPIVNVPGCPVQPDNFMETLLYLLRQVGRAGADDSHRRGGAPKWLFDKTVHEGCDRAAYYEQGDFAQEYGSPKCLVKIGCWGPVVQCNVPKRGWMAGDWRMSQCRRHLHRLHHARLPGQVHALHGRAPRSASFPRQLIKPYGVLIRNLRRITQHTLNREPKWRHNARQLTTGYQPSMTNGATPLKWRQDAMSNERYAP